MFHKGDLDSDINKALKESKLVACFVTDAGEESELWEHHFLEVPSIKSALSQQTVLLRLTAGSQEAGYLAAIYPLPQTPTFVIIKNGELKEYIAPGIAKEEFVRRLEVALHIIAPDSPTTQLPPRRAVPPTISSTQPIPPVKDQSSSSTPSSSTAAPSTSATTNPTSEPETFSEVRAARISKAKAEQDAKILTAKEKAARALTAKAEQDAKEEAGAPGSKKAADMKFALMQKKRQQDIRDERARILKRVEDDKTERRNREIQRKSDTPGQAGTSELSISGSSTGIRPSSRSKTNSSTQAAECAVQIRLFDGSTIRSKFPSDSNLLTHVRPWIDSNQESSSNQPYTFKQVLTPLPNKNISVSDEETSLLSLGLAPSATFIILPVGNYTSAYSEGGGGATGFVYRWFSAGYGLVSSGFGILIGVLALLGRFLSSTNSASQEKEDEQAPAHAQRSGGQSSSINIRTLRDQDKKEDQQFYNGNALNFEPRKDHDDDDKKDD